jgi:hypothetical protein
VCFMAGINQGKCALFNLVDMENSNDVSKWFKSIYLLPFALQKWSCSIHNGEHGELLWNRGSSEGYISIFCHDFN